MMSRWLCLLLAAALALLPAFPPTFADTRPAPEDHGASSLALALRRLQTIANVLHTAAHPDDESTELLAYLARGQGARVAYLSLNRGEGGPQRHRAGTRREPRRAQDGRVARGAQTRRRGAVLHAGL